MGDPTGRQPLADELRGFALLGIATVNAPFLGISLGGWTEASIASPLDRLAAGAVVAFAQAKFYVLFAFLFGYSYAFTVRESGDRSAAPTDRVRWRRRLAGLAVLGVLHAALLFVGDILLAYAALGLLVPWLSRWSDRALGRGAAIVLAVWAIALAAMVAALAALPPPGSEEPAFVADYASAMRDAGFVAATLGRLQAWPVAQAIVLTFNAPCVLAMFALGVLAARHRLLAEADRHDAVWMHGARWGLAVGLPAALASAWMAVGPGADASGGGLRETGGIALGFVSAPLLTWGYVSWIVRARRGRPDLMRIFRRSGRLSLTGYLGESALLSLVFCGYGLALFGELGAAAVLAVALATWVAIDAFATVWERRLGRGPLERVLRAWVR